MRALLRAIPMLALGAALVSGCGGGGGRGGTGPGTPADVMVVQAVPDAPPVDVLIDGRAILTGFAYPDHTNYNAESAGMRTIRVNQAGTATTLVQSDLSLTERKFQSVFVTGMAANTSLLHIQDDLSHPPAGQSKVRFVNLSPDAGAMDMGFEGQPALFTSLGFKGYSNFQNVPMGGQTIEIRQAGTATVVASVSVHMLNQGVYTVILRGLVAGAGGQALAASSIPNK